MIGAYIKCLIITMAICSLILYLAPEFAGSTKKYLQYLCGLVMLITLISPLMKSCESIESIKEEAVSFFSEWERIPSSQPESIREAVVQGTVTETAYAIMTYLHSEYKLPRNGISVSVITDDGESPVINELHLYLSNCSAADREKIRMDIESMIQITTYVFGKE